jgi:hypothetical protein
MATSIAIEEDSGTGTGRIRTHNGYYAGDFFADRHQAPRHSPSISLQSARPAGTYARPAVADWSEIAA